MRKNWLILFCVLLGHSFLAQHPNLIIKADSMLLENIGQQLFDEYVQFDHWEIDTIQENYRASDSNDLLLQDSVHYHYKAVYHLLLFDTVQNEMWVTFDEKQKVYQHNIYRVEEEYKKFDEGIISEFNYKAKLAKSFRKKVKHRGYFISEYGLVGYYTYWPRGRRFYTGYTWISLHTGDKVKDYQMRPFF